MFHLRSGGFPGKSLKYSFLVFCVVRDEKSISGEVIMFMIFVPTLEGEISFTSEINKKGKTAKRRRKISFRWKYFYTENIFLKNFQLANNLNYCEKGVLVSNNFLGKEFAFFALIRPGNRGWERENENPLSKFIFTLRFLSISPHLTKLRREFFPSFG